MQFVNYFIGLRKTIKVAFKIEWLGQEDREIWESRTCGPITAWECRSLTRFFRGVQYNQEG